MSIGDPTAPLLRDLAADAGLTHLDPSRRLGATVVDGGVRFEVWAPDATSVSVHVHDAVGPDGNTDTDVTVFPLERVTAPTGAPDDGCWATVVPGRGAGTRYRFSVDGDAPLPDPASALQPDGVHGPSEVVDPADPTTFVWSDTAWRGVPMSGSVVYELHVGTFTPDGTLDAAITQLDRLVDLGVTTVELMPLNATPGSRNWGYDGVYPMAVHEAYGGPAALCRFVDAAHAHGLAVIADVVHNHLGPEGNYLGRFGPYFTDALRTPWGPAVNTTGPGSDGVRRYVLEHLWRWTTEYHLDGYRLDAVHAIVDTSAVHLLEQVAAVVHAAGAAQRRRTVVISETADNDPRFLRPVHLGGFAHDGVWNDDLHHSIRVAVTGDRRGYYADYAGDAAELADVLTHRWAFRGRYSIARGRMHGRPVDDRAPHHFVVCSQNHDQVGNRPAGDRPDRLVTPEDRRLMAQIVLLSPFTPLLFMGEEYGEQAPFPFFVDHGDRDVLEATRRGRRDEFPAADWGVEVPDPGHAATFSAAVLDPTVTDREPHRSMLAMYTELLRLRRDHPVVCDPATRRTVRVHDHTVVVHATAADGSRGLLAIHLGHEPVSVPAPEGAAVVFDGADPVWRGEAGTGRGSDTSGTVTVAPRTALLAVTPAR